MRPEAAGDVIYDMALYYVGTDVPASLGDSRLSSGRIIRLVDQSDPFCALSCGIYSSCILQLTGSTQRLATSYPAYCEWPIVLDKHVKFRDPCLNRSREIPPEAVADGILRQFFHNNFRLEVVTDVLSGVAVDHVGVDILVKIGDSRSNGSRYIRKTAFVSNKHITQGGNALWAFRLKCRQLSYHLDGQIKFLQIVYEIKSIGKHWILQAELTDMKSRRSMWLKITVDRSKNPTIRWGQAERHADLNSKTLPIFFTPAI